MCVMGEAMNPIQNQLSLELPFPFHFILQSDIEFMLAIFCVEGGELFCHNRSEVSWYS